MAFRFKRRESIAAAFARIAAEQIDDAVAALEKPSAAGVHSARIFIKRLRGLLRLFCGALPEGSFDRENEALRTAARQLSSQRDAQVRLAGFDALSRGIKTPGVAQARRHFLAACRASAPAHRTAAPYQATITVLRAAGARLPGLKPDSRWSVLSRGLKATYRRARQACATARAELSTSALHTWRRRSKEFEFQMRLLRKIDPLVMKRRLRQAALVTDLLGVDHDLAVLERTLAAVRELPSELREKLGARIARRRKKLQRTAFKLGSELFFEKPSVVVKELGRQWKSWRRG